MIKKMIGVLCLCFISIASFAQLSIANRVIISTHDGSVFIGHIVQEDELHIDLLVITEDTLHIHKGIIRDIRRNSKDILIHPNGKLHYTGGYFYSTSLGWGGNFDESPSADLDFIVGKRLNKRFSVGMGAAISLNTAVLPNWFWVDHHFLPVFAYGRYYLNDKKVRPYAFSRLGYGFKTNIIWSDDHTGGLHFQPGLGIHFASRKSARFILSISQMIQHTKGTRTNFDVFSNPVSFKYSQWYNRTMLKVGIEFH